MIMNRLCGHAIAHNGHAFGQGSVHHLGIDAEALCSDAQDYINEIGCEDVGYLDIISSGKRARMPIAGNKTLSIASLTDFLDWLCAKKREIDVDYIHGEDTLERLAVCGAVGIYCEKMDKAKLFTAVGKDGPLPRKTFSMGHAEDKRYYLEARRIQY